jgi:HK97 family phage portal protein
MAGLFEYFFGSSGKSSTASEGRQYHPSANPPKWMGLGAMTSTSGIVVTDSVAENISAFFAGKRILKETLGMLPVHKYQKLERGREKVYDKLTGIIRRKPNRWHTSMEWRENIMECLIMRGNSYNQIIRQNNGQISEIVPLNPDNVTVTMNGKMELVYKYRDTARGIQTNLSSDEVLHFRAFSKDGFVGRSLLTVCAEVFEKTAATEQYGSAALGNGVSLAGVLYSEKSIDDAEAIKRLREQFEDRYSGPSNSGKPLILEDGMKWEAMQVNLADMQFLESRKFQIAELARILRIPPHMLGDLDRATFSNIEHQSQEFISSSIGPWVKRIEETMNVFFFGLDENQYFEFNMDAFLRGDTLSRYNAYQIAVTNGIMTQNECREKENLNPLEGGDELMTPLNMSKDNADKQQDDSTEDARSCFETALNAALHKSVQLRNEGKDQEAYDSILHVALSYAFMLDGRASKAKKELVKTFIKGLNVGEMSTEKIFEGLENLK